MRLYDKKISIKQGQALFGCLCKSYEYAGEELAAHRDFHGRI